ncbi:MAG: isocitrate/isopropylmalate dehydrogenase family protein [Clostridia bacterium]|nr:isocitrate/isopropylmalate dehydrogenase family protein [Clostridia bacterium]
MESYTESFEKIVSEQLARLEKIKASPEYTDFAKLDKIVVGIINGDGIGPYIMAHAVKVLNTLLGEEISSGRVELRNIEGLTLENRVAKLKTLPDDVLAQIKQCNVLLKGPTTTPDKSAGLPNLESANVALRRELDLFANVRPVSIPEKGINWIFYRENTEGEYVLGSRGVDVNDEMSIDFKVITDAGTKRIAKAAFEYAKNNGNLNVSIITKANIMKKTDGKFKDICYEVAKGYPQIKTDDWYVDIAAANLVNPQMQKNFNVFVLPNLYGDIITDEAAQIQGGVGTAGSANIGGSYAMFEAVHGSAPRMIADGLTDYANPSSILKAASMLLRHIGFSEKAQRLESALAKARTAANVTGFADGDTAEKFMAVLLENL